MNDILLGSSSVKMLTQETTLHLPTHRPLSSATVDMLSEDELSLELIQNRRYPSCKCIRQPLSKTSQLLAEPYCQTVTIWALDSEGLQESAQRSQICKKFPFRLPCTVAPHCLEIGPVCLAQITVPEATRPI